MWDTIPAKQCVVIKYWDKDPSSTPAGNYCILYSSTKLSWQFFFPILAKMAQSGPFYQLMVVLRDPTNPLPLTCHPLLYQQAANDLAFAGKLLLFSLEADALLNAGLIRRLWTACVFPSDNTRPFPKIRFTRLQKRTFISNFFFSYFESQCPCFFHTASTLLFLERADLGICLNDHLKLYEGSFAD